LLKENKSAVYNVKIEGRGRKPMHSEEEAKLIIEAMEEDRSLTARGVARNPDINLKNASHSLIN